MPAERYLWVEGDNLLEKEPNCEQMSENGKELRQRAFEIWNKQKKKKKREKIFQNKNEKMWKKWILKNIKFTKLKITKNKNMEFFGGVRLETKLILIE